MGSGTQRRIGLRKTTVAIGVAVLAMIPAQPAQAAPKAAPACGSVVTHDIRLKADLVCAGDALVVDGAGRITVDLNGHTISSGGTALTVRGSTLVTVERGRVSSLTAESAVRLRNVSLEELEFEAPIDARRVTVTGRTTGHRHDGRTAFRSSTLGTVTLVGVLGAVFTGNTIGSLTVADAPGTLVRGNTVGSVSAHQSDEVTIADNRVRQITVGQSRGLHALRNRVTGNGTHNGISLSFIEPGLQGSVISRNTVRNATTGISVTELLGEVTIWGNTVEGNSVAGLTGGNLLTGALVVTGNTFRRNGFASSSLDPAGRTVNDGVHIFLRADRPGSTARLARNISTGNTGFGLEVVGSPDQIRDGGGNRAARNGEGACWGLACR